MACGSECCRSAKAGKNSADLSPPALDAVEAIRELADATKSSLSTVNDNIKEDKVGSCCLPEQNACESKPTQNNDAIVTKPLQDIDKDRSDNTSAAMNDLKSANSCHGTATCLPVKIINPDDCCTPSGPCAESKPTASRFVTATSSTYSPKEGGTAGLTNGEVKESSCCSLNSNTPRLGADVANSCCAPQSGRIKCNADVKSNAGSSCQENCWEKEESECRDGCCGQEQSSCNDGCCGDADEPSGQEDRCVGDNPLSKSYSCGKNRTVVDTLKVVANAPDTTDIEKGSTGKEHIILSVSGMTCTGCETKLKRVLGSLSYVSNLKTSLVMARAELDILDGASTAEDIVKHLHRTTEFKCERISNQGYSLDLLCSGNSAAIIDGEWPKGVLEIISLDKITIRVTFDAKILGARDLLEQEWVQPIRLAPPRMDSTLDAGNRHVRKIGLMTLLSAILTIPVLVLAWAPLPDRDIAYGSASLALATVVQVVIAGPFYPKAIKALVFSKVIEMDLLIVLSTSAAYIFSVVSFGYLVIGRPLSTGEFFETSTLLVTLIMVGRWVASLARQKAAESISIRTLQAQTAIIIGPDQSEREIDARLLQYGDYFKVTPDTRICTDGTVISGNSEVDESMLTGEAKPVEKYGGSTVIAGSINGLGMLTVRLTRLPGDNTIATIACMVDEAKLSKPKIQDIADTVASYFVPVVIMLATITFVIWIAIGMTVRHQSGAEATIQAITYAITVLIVSCPCAIGLAVPMVIVVASGVAARRGVVFKSAGSIEIAHKTTDVVFDKTGTLTLGRLSVVDEVYFDNNLEWSKTLLNGLLADIKHPVSAAVATHLNSQGSEAAAIQDTKVIAGKGVEGNFKGQILRAGNSRWLGVSSNPHVVSALSKDLTTFCFTIDNALVAVLGLQDTIRSDSVATVAQLCKRGIKVHMLSGDDDGAVRSIASQLNISREVVRSRCSPSDKQAYIKDLLSTPSLSSKGKSRKPVVMFVGDGTNDAVALAQATIGVHVSGGTDIAQSAADVVLIRSDLSCVLTILAVSSKAMNRVAFNFGWSFVYNLFAVLLGAGAFVNARIPPQYAGLGELVSVLPVIVAAMLLRWSRI
jgi:heavy metal translocating P-type ATPase